MLYHLFFVTWGCFEAPPHNGYSGGAAALAKPNSLTVGLSNRLDNASMPDAQPDGSLLEKVGEQIKNEKGLAFI